MINILKIFFGSIVTSFYFFPFEFTFLPGVNTKMMIAVVGLMFFGYDMVHKGKGSLPKWLLYLFLGAAIVSTVGLLSITVNNTSDTAYVTYFISMSVWLGASYAVCRSLILLDDNISVESICKYVAIVCTAQCILALVINSYSTAQTIVDRYVLQDQEFLHRVKRIYGIGASLDTAGTRFTACLVMITHVLIKNGKSYGYWKLLLYISAFIVITIIGNIIARTTLVGVVVSLIYVILNRIFSFYEIPKDGRHRIGRTLLIPILLAIPICTLEYNNNATFRKLLRFGFEGFFSLAEKGRWEVSSNNTLEGMVVFPDNVKTWVIGDGYFENQRNDINYIGDATEGGYYMGTDVGYLRFTFYFGLIGLLSFLAFLIMSARLCSEQNPDDSPLPYMIATAGLIIWFKVATDLFLVFALLICAGYLHKSEEEGVEPVDDQA